VKKVAKEDITQAMIDELHSRFIGEMERLFERTKVKHAGYEKAVLSIH
jgi:rRNA pseudouridine-1189 N-methylase Emg1 (Nep1/Mra1 family)